MKVTFHLGYSARTLLDKIPNVFWFPPSARRAERSPFNGNQALRSRDTRSVLGNFEIQLSKSWLKWLNQLAYF